MLHTGETFGRIVILVMDMQVVLGHRFTNRFAQQIVIDERFGRLACKLHHHAGRSVRIHVCILACDVVRFDVDDLQKHIACLGLAGDTSLVAISNVFLGHILPAAVHQFQFHGILDVFNGHLRFASESDVIRDGTHQLLVLSTVRMQHGFADGSGDFVLVESDDSSVSFNDCLYHNALSIFGCKSCFFKTRQRYVLLIYVSHFGKLFAT